MGDVRKLDQIVTGKVRVSFDDMVEGARKNLDFNDTVIVVGFGKDEDLYLAFNYGDKADLIYLLEVAKHELLTDG